MHNVSPYNECVHLLHHLGIFIIYTIFLTLLLVDTYLATEGQSVENLGNFRVTTNTASFFPTYYVYVCLPAFSGSSDSVPLAAFKVVTGPFGQNIPASSVLKHGNVTVFEYKVLIQSLYHFLGCFWFWCPCARTAKERA